ncbi:serine hydrolase domain-containing protein [Nocardiopsis halotolerans]|uniref:serine hydrolase domain-containing protein n=1 Tax=Nocardiopsis halotolerans TaxID=124252 RepID=UPI00034B8201|nr:serine hydrolase domain-containing protein [Nocardiopsis halotolerans]
MRTPLALLLALAPVVPAVLVASAALASPSAPAAPPPAPAVTPATLDSYARERMEATDTPGLAYAVIGPEGVEHQGLHGVDGDGAPVDEHTPFLWGSVAKPVTATAALVLAEEGRLDLDARVAEYLPAFGDFGADPTVRDLLTQTSGLTSDVALSTSDVHGEGSADFDARVARIAASDPGDPGTHEYSSANYLVLGAVIEEVTGDFAAHLRTSVLDPLGMDGAFVSAEEAREAGLTPGHRTLWGVQVADADGVDDAGVSYGYLGGDLTDLSAFAQAQLDADPPVLDAAVLERARTGTVPVPGSDQEYGLGWRDTALDDLDEPIVFHGGATPGHASMVVLLPGHERAVVVLQNAYGVLRDGGIQAVAFGLAHLVAGGDSPASPGSDPLYPAAVWVPTAAAVALGAGGVAAIRVRRPRPWATALWSFLGLVAAGTAVWLVAGFGLRPALTWLPDVSVALLVAGVLGAAVTVLRLRAHRGDRSHA